MAYKNEKPDNTNKPGYGKVLQGPWGQGPAATGSRYSGGANAVKHCPTCACGQHGTDANGLYQGGKMGGLESALANMGIQLPGGAAPVAYQITIYALPQELLGGYGNLNATGTGNYNARGRYDFSKKKDNDSYSGDKGRYDTKRAA